MFWIIYVGSLILFAIAIWVIMWLMMKIALLCLDGYEYHQLKEGWKEFDQQHPMFSDDPRWREHRSTMAEEG